MTSFIGRLIGSAQRCISLETPDLEPWPDCLKLNFHIQGIELIRPEEALTLNYYHMAKHGIEKRETVPLRLWERLLRRPALVGEVFEDEHHILHVRFWTEPEVSLQIDLNDPKLVEDWSECYIMVRSGGFDFFRPHE